MASRSADEIGECFGACYEAATNDARMELEQRVFGSDYGADGWTTLAQADDLIRYLDLGPGRRLLDIGTGRGWPGLYLALRTGCDAVLTDQPLEALQQAVARARRDGTAGRAAVVASTARALPFRPASFDAVVHTDVLCCLGPKREMLAESRRLLRPGGQTGFYVIHLAAHLTGAERRRAREAGPPAVVTRARDYSALLRSAGFVDVLQVDVSDAYRATHRAWMRHARAMAEELAAADPTGAFPQRVEDHVLTAAAIEEGLLRRSLFVARRPGGARTSGQQSRTTTLPFTSSAHCQS